MKSVFFQDVSIEQFGYVRLINKKNIIKLMMLYHFQTTKQKHTLIKFYF